MVDNIALVYTPKLEGIIYDIDGTKTVIDAKYEYIPLENINKKEIIEEIQEFIQLIVDAQFEPHIKLQ